MLFFFTRIEKFVLSKGLGRNRWGVTMAFKIQAHQGPQLIHYYKLLTTVSNTQTSHKTTLLNILEKKTLRIKVKTHYIYINLLGKSSSIWLTYGPEFMLHWLISGMRCLLLSYYCPIFICICWGTCDVRILWIVLIWSFYFLFIQHPNIFSQICPSSW